MTVSKRFPLAALLLLPLALLGCDDGVNPAATNAEALRMEALDMGFAPLSPPPATSAELVELGQLLLFDPVLSGDHDVSCMTCHHPNFATADDRQLPVGVGGAGLGQGRTHPEKDFIPRNAPPVFNMHAMDVMFWDGRVEVNAVGRLRTPAEEDVTPEMEAVFTFGAAAAQALFPVTSRDEMRGHEGTELSELDDDDFEGMWRALMRRLGQFQGYRDRFEAAYPGTPFDSMTFAHAANAMAAFEATVTTSINTPWDLFLAGDTTALTPVQLQGADIFLDKCSSCHSGALLSDERFHVTALAQFGPGKGNGPSGRDDFGRENVTRDPIDRYKVRTAPLRNVTLTGPWGRLGQYVSLRDFIRHYDDAALRLREYGAEEIRDPALKNTLLDNKDEIIERMDPDLVGLTLTEREIGALLEFMEALTDPDALVLGPLIPASVPSGLPVER